MMEILEFVGGLVVVAVIFILLGCLAYGNYYDMQQPDDTPDDDAGTT